MLTTTAIVIALVLVLIWFIAYIYREEAFANKNDKANAIVNWFAGVSTPSYASFRRATGGDSNIVEYEDARRLYAEKNLTVENLVRIL
jgi:hypothetical protein